MKIEAFVYDEYANYLDTIVYNGIDLETIINDIDITCKGWDLARIEYEGGYCLVFSDGAPTLYFSLSEK